MPGDDQLAVVATDEIEVDRAGVNCGGDAELNAAGGRSHLSDAGGGLRHEPGGATRAACGIRPAEEQEDGVASPLQQFAAARLGDVELRRERVGDDLADLLCARLAPNREPLAQGREAGDVDERERAVDGLVRAITFVFEPLEREPRHVRSQPFRGRRGGRNARTRRGSSRYPGAMVAVALVVASVAPVALPSFNENVPRPGPTYRESTPET